MAEMTGEATIDLEVRRHVDQLLRRVLTIDGFEEWFVGATWDNRTDLVKDVDLLLAERHVRLEEDVVGQLADLAATVVVRDIPAVVFSGCNVVVEGRLTDQPTVIHRRAEFAGTRTAAGSV